ncbi:hypothetical protein LCGC14_1623730 [marine sediment metagenome]|uniref:Nucleotidyl transferase domain-containing protein n=1 Tax=marine sediment metagenome TaxID=412755 RepID=A0A0F9KKB5_9ZZZZ
MKALVLAGGSGTRLRPITHTSAKQLVPVANKPVLFYCLETLLEAGIDDIGIIVGETQQEIRAAIGDGSRFGVKVTYIEQPDPLGLAHAVKISEDFLKNDDFVMFLGDNLIKDGISTLVKEFNKNKPNAQILLAEVENPSQFGVAQLNGNKKVVKLVEKPKDPASNLALVGVYMFDKSIMKAVNSIKPSNRNELEITDAIQHLIDSGHEVEPHVIKGWWKDTGKLEDMLEANRMMLEGVEGNEGEVDKDSKLFGSVRLEKGSKIINSVIRGPVTIGENTVVDNSYIGPFSSIYYDCVIKNSEIEHSIILEKSSVSDMHRIEDSLVGKNVTISKTEQKPKAYRLMLGDSSNVEVI